MNEFVLQTKSSRVVKEADRVFNIVVVSPNSRVAETGIEEVIIFDDRSEEEIFDKLTDIHDRLGIKA